MADPRNVAHDKKVIQKRTSRKNRWKVPETTQPGKKPEAVKHDDHEDPATARETAAADKAEASGETMPDDID